VVSFHIHFEAYTRLLTLLIPVYHLICLISPAAVSRDSELDKRSNGGKNSVIVGKKLGKPKIGFPEDEGAHRTFPVEWW
jgi:hypothetical protein